MNHCGMNSHRLQTRLEFWREKLVTVERALEAEMRKRYRSRNSNLLLFLYREKVVCANVISELYALVEEANDTPSK
jgi:hypothetical protein